MRSPVSFLRRLAPLLCLTWVALAQPVTTPAHLHDPAGLFAVAGDAAQLWQERLAAFERETGIRVLVRFEAHSPEASADAQPGQYMRALATELGVARDGAVAVYFADEPDWRLWIGAELVARFAGQDGTETELTANDAIHDMKERLFAEALAAAEAAPPEARLRAQTDTLLHGLLGRLRKR
jgi:hypothetical protein